MEDAFKLIALVYCLVCRIGFEILGMVLIWVTLPFGWAMTLTCMYGLWLLLGAVLED